MSEGAMPDLAGEVVAQLEALHDADRRPLHVESGGTKLCVKRRGAHLMYVLQLLARSHDIEQEEIFFDMANVNDAINQFVAKTKGHDSIPLASRSELLSVRLQHDKAGTCAEMSFSFKPTFDVAQSEVGDSLRSMLSAIQNALA
eukprot:CAMPEP_0183352736 /NCGR_PEP_ID=MMETSP0164_2-20130417/30097_1 /TAXON_ID=221442 /ORGANISM="Coccolithus pelagicus ssp braarudi, Strain PLY182g" /LENGTH=143 /DNA_ID=CAMNT_0025525251 /DNA_START=46 /DNA_END=477 /DNA_ORIENTATION=-